MTGVDMDPLPSHAFPRRAVILALALTGIVVLAMSGLTLLAAREARRAGNRSHQLVELRGQILLFDEALTMSARMGAATGAFRWERRYHENEARLATALAVALRLAPSLEGTRALHRTRRANRKLVAMEHRAFDLVNRGRDEQARALLASAAYSRAKDAYARGMGRLRARIQEAEEAARRAEKASYWRLSGLGSLGLLLLAGTWGWAFRAVYRWRDQRAFLQEALLNHLGEGVFSIDAGGRFTFANPAALKLLGYDDAQQVLGENRHRLIHHTDAEGSPYPEVECPISQVMQQGRPLEAWQDVFWRRDGSGFPVEVYATPLWREHGSVSGGVVIFRDISERKRLEGRLRYLARHDPLTDLFNRTAFEARLDEEWQRAQRYGTGFALVMFDLDHFKEVNDRYGHGTGDQALREVGRLAREELRASDTIGRWGGEEFLILLPETGVEGAACLAERLRRRIAEHPFRGPDRITVSLGVALHRSGQTQEDLLKGLDNALYRAKEAGRNRVETAPEPA